MDAFIKPMNTTLEDGVKVACKRKGLKIILTVGEKTGAGLMRRIDVSQDPVLMLEGALAEAAKEAQVKLTLENEEIYLEA